MDIIEDGDSLGWIEMWEQVRNTIERGPLVVYIQEGKNIKYLKNPIIIFDFPLICIYII